MIFDKNRVTSIVKVPFLESAEVRKIHSKPIMERRETYVHIDPRE